MRHDRTERFSVSTYFSQTQYQYLTEQQQRNIRISVMNSFLLSSTSQHCQHFPRKHEKYKNVWKSFPKKNAKNTQNTAAQWEKSLIYIFSFCITEPNPDVTKHKKPTFQYYGSFGAPEFFSSLILIFLLLLFWNSKDSFLPLYWIYSWHTTLLYLEIGINTNH